MDTGGDDSEGYSNELLTSSPRANGPSQRNSQIEDALAVPPQALDESSTLAERDDASSEDVSMMQQPRARASNKSQPSQEREQSPRPRAPTQGFDDSDDESVEIIPRTFPSRPQTIDDSDDEVQQNAQRQSLYASDTELERSIESTELVEDSIEEVQVPQISQDLIEDVEEFPADVLFPLSIAQEIWQKLGGRNMPLKYHSSSATGGIVARFVDMQARENTGERRSLLAKIEFRADGVENLRREAHVLHTLIRTETKAAPSYRGSFAGVAKRAALWDFLNRKTRITWGELLYLAEDRELAPAELIAVNVVITTYIPSVTLKEMMELNNSAVAVAVFQSFQRILRTLQELHRHNIFHNDMDPQNVLITAEMHPTTVLFDFGTACADTPRARCTHLARFVYTLENGRRMNMENANRSVLVAHDYYQLCQMYLDYREFIANEVEPAGRRFPVITGHADAFFRSIEQYVRNHEAFLWTNRHQLDEDAMGEVWDIQPTATCADEDLILRSLAVASSAVAEQNTLVARLARAGWQEIIMKITREKEEQFWGPGAK